jgi:adenine specific DNA methylase Mod
MKIQKWEPDNFELEMNTVWSFPERGNWATHDAKYRGNWSPYIPRNLILRYSKTGETVLDQFAGGGTTLVEAKLLNRNIIGIDINPEALQRCKMKTEFDYPNAGNVQANLSIRLLTDTNFYSKITAEQ